MLKFQLGKLFPGVDAGNEAVLSQALTSLAIDELAKFKGPTTDFEYEKAQATVGALGDPKTANIARIKGMQRNNWFVNKESKQFNAFIKAKGNPDLFEFNFGEPIRTKRGVFTLQDLQDTAVEKNLNIEEVLKRLNQ